MATRVDLSLEMVRQTINTKMQSINRAIKVTSNPIIKDALTQELASLQKAVNSLTESK